jgi:DNA-binding transcriptional ArsR family regulator
MQHTILTFASVLACPTRLFLLQSVGEDGLDVTRAAVAAGVSTSTASFHLAKLLDAGLVVRHRKGRMRVYSWGPVRYSIHAEPAPPSSSTAT